MAPETNSSLLYSLVPRIIVFSATSSTTCAIVHGSCFARVKWHREGANERNGQCKPVQQCTQPRRVDLYSRRRMAIIGHYRTLRRDKPCRKSRTLRCCC